MSDQSGLSKNITYSSHVYGGPAEGFGALTATARFDSQAGIQSSH